MESKFPLIYFLALFFGLIHGLGFSNYLKGILGKDENIVTQLLAFNLGLEAGQLLIVAAVLIITFACLQVIKLNRREYIVLLSGAVFGLALLIALERWPVKKKKRVIGYSELPGRINDRPIPKIFHINKLRII